VSESRLALRPFTEACIEPFLALAATYYPEGHEARNPAYLRWAFLQNPAGVGRIAHAETDSGKWTGVMGLVPFRIQHGPRQLTASMVVNVLVHPDHRKEKLFVKMIEHTCAELRSSSEWLIGHPNAAAVPGWQRTKMGFRPGYQMRVVPPLLSPRRRAGVRVKDGGSALLAADFSPLAEWQQRLGHPVIAADASFLSWRFLSHPTRRYYRLHVDRDERGVTGYRVERPFKTRLVRWFVDWQGEEYWRRGPVRGALPSFYAWPVQSPHPSSSIVLPRFQKDYPFFATPCSTMENDGDPWSHLSLAATDFA
jgi:hypothetical protein